MNSCNLYFEKKWEFKKKKNGSDKIHGHVYFETTFGIYGHSHFYEVLKRIENSTLLNTFLCNLALLWAVNAFQRSLFFISFLLSSSSVRRFKINEYISRAVTLPFVKGGQLSKEWNCSFWSKFFPFIADLISGRDFLSGQVNRKWKKSLVLK